MKPRMHWPNRDDDEREEFLVWPWVFALAMFIVLAVMALGR